MIYILDPHGALIEKRLGRNFDMGESFQAAIEAGNRFHCGSGSGRAKSLLEAKMGVADAHFLALKPAF